MNCGEKELASKSAKEEDEESDSSESDEEVDCESEWLKTDEAKDDRGESSKSDEGERVVNLKITLIAPDFYDKSKHRINIIINADGLDELAEIGPNEITADVSGFGLENKKIMNCNEKEIASKNVKEEDDGGETSGSAKQENRENESPESDKGEVCESEWLETHEKKDDVGESSKCDEGESVVNLKITAITPDFYDKSNHRLNTKAVTGYNGLDKLTEIVPGVITAHVHGFGLENKEYVAIRFCDFDGNCNVSLIDASENRRFSQTFSFSLTDDREVIVDKYISHKQLLSDPDDLLPNGTLTLLFDVWVTLHDKKHSDYGILSIIKNFGLGSQSVQTILDSAFVKQLLKVSSVFRAMMIAPMIENKTNCVNIPREELEIFINMKNVLFRNCLLSFDSIKDVFDLYILGDKYDIPLLIDNCICFLKLYASASGTDILFETADKYFKDEYLNQLLRNEISLICQTNLAEEIYAERDSVYFKKPLHGYLWSFKYSYDRENLLFSKEKIETEATSNFIHDEDRGHDFYT